MSTITSIDKSRVLPISTDYERLKTKGLEHIEQLSHKIWTDYNTHDPGITSLEVLCYALTELGYRSQFNIKDLICNTNGDINNATFFTAKNILTNAALTALDFRKLLIDIEGVNNAWISYAKNTLDDVGYNMPLENEIPIYINPLEDKLSFHNKDKKNNSLEQLKLRGLNKIRVELSNDEQLGNLNEVTASYSEFVDSNFLEVNVSTTFNDWNDQGAKLFRLMNTPAKIIDKSIEIEGDQVKIVVKRTSNPTQLLTLFLKPREADELNLIAAHFDSEIQICLLIDKLKSKKEKVDHIYKKINKKINNNRNLTEDWLCTETIKKTPVSICADLHIHTNADTEETLAKVYQAINQIIDPKIQFFTLNQMLNKGLDTTEIFNGPALKHGFLLDEEVEKAQLPDCLHASDFISIIMQIEGVKDIKNFLFTAYDTDGKPIEDAKNQAWCLQLDGETKPIFSIEKSKLLPFKDGIPFSLSEIGQRELADGMSYLSIENNYLKLNDTPTDISIPKGNYLPIYKYLSVQYEYPETYRIGKDQMPASASKERKAQAKQLKAYLQHYDQLLADFFSQLYNAKSLLNTTTIDRTYFPNFIEDTDGVELELFKKEIYTSDFEHALKSASSATHESFYESKNQFFKRRHRFLDHLMARFSESFNDYAFMMYQVQEHANGFAEQKIHNQELIEDKQRFLENYPEISANRGLGFNYLQNPTVNDLWDSSQKTGFEKRIALLLGINNTRLSDATLFDATAQNLWQYDTDIGVLKFKITNTSGLSLQEKWTLAHQLISKISSFKIRKATVNYFIDIVTHDQQRIAKLDQSFSTKQDAIAFIPKLFQAIHSTLENFYCVEHILLRPLLEITAPETEEKDKHLLQVCLNDDCFSEANQDPYSFKITIVLRGDLARFRNNYFRKYAEKTIRQEAPAHVLVKICWVSKQEMLEFQTVYKNWIIAYRKLKQKLCNNAVSNPLRKSYNKSLKKIIETIKALNTIYDEGTLYNCELSALDNPLVLGKTALGTLKK